jgi:hypothetical protein
VSATGDVGARHGSIDPKTKSVIEIFIRRGRRVIRPPRSSGIVAPMSDDEHEDAYGDDWTEHSVTRDAAERTLLRWLGDLEAERDPTDLLAALADADAVHRTLAGAGPGKPLALLVCQHLRLVDILSVFALGGGGLADTCLAVIDHCHAELAKLAPPGRDFPKDALGSPTRLLVDNHHRRFRADLDRERQAYAAWRSAAPPARVWHGADLLALRLLGYMTPAVHHADRPDLGWIHDRTDDPIFWLADAIPEIVTVWFALHQRLYTTFIDARSFDCDRAEADALRHARRPLEALARRREVLVAALPHAPESIGRYPDRFLAGLH